MKKHVYMLLASLVTAAQAFAGGTFGDSCSDGCGFDSVITVDLGGGIRKDKIQWKSFQPGLETKEKWHDIKIGTINGTAKLLVSETYLARFDFDYGWIYHKGHQNVKKFDTTVTPSILLSELSADTKGHVYDLSGALGYQFNWCCYQYALTPMVGYAYDVQDFKNNGYTDVLVSTDTAFASTDNSYKYRWEGPWVGFSAAFQPTCEWQIYLDYSYHWARVRASLNESFALDSASHLRSNKAHGNEVTIGTSYVFCNCWSVGLRFDYLKYTSNKGKIRNSTSCANVRSLRWTSYDGVLDVGYSF